MGSQRVGHDLSNLASVHATQDYFLNSEDSYLKNVNIKQLTGVQRWGIMILEGFCEY